MGNFVAKKTVDNNSTEDVIIVMPSKTLPKYFVDYTPYKLDEIQDPNIRMQKMRAINYMVNNAKRFNLNGETFPRQFNGSNLN